MEESIINKLDLADYISQMKSLFAREKSIVLQGDINIHFNLINEISTYNFKTPPKIDNLDKQLIHLTKQGVLKLYEIYEFIKIINYFQYIQKFTLDGKLEQWISKITIPTQIEQISDIFDKKGNIKQGVNEDYDLVTQRIYNNTKAIKDALYSTMGNKKLQPYLVDHQVHLVHSEQTILVRAGFNSVVKAKVLDRSNAGFFYIVPSNVSSLKQKQEELLNLKEQILMDISKEYSNIFIKHILFLKFINKEFDRLDHYLARVFFAKTDDKNFILPKSNHIKEKLVEFKHPAISHPKAVTIDFGKKVIMITGVNAGGKTMLLKSLLSATYMSKYLIPYKADKKTTIGHYKDIVAILDDPQSVKNDISTFAGRMVEFSKIFTKQSAIVGVDEIELGTDSDEAASLFKVIIEKLMKKNIKVIITTHHKRLASLMAGYDEVELVAALYDEANRRPTYEFMQGTIGQSYAFETALRYGIPHDIINQAKEVYGKDSQKLNELIAKSASLEQEYRKKIEQLDFQIAKNNKLQLLLKEEKEHLDYLIYEEKSKLHKEYSDVKEEAKKAIKAKRSQESHRHLNIAHKKVKSIQTKTIDEQIVFKVNDRVKYSNTKGTIISIKGKKAQIETDDGIKLYVETSKLKRSGNEIKVKPKKSISVKISKPNKGDIKLDLHGQRGDEAIENLDKFLSDCLMNGFDEVLIYHGIGTGKLSKLVKEFLDRHPKVKSYSDAPYNQGGFGAKVVKF